MDPLYQENILDHYRNPRNGKPIANYQVKQLGSNPSCGDELSLYLAHDDAGAITDVGYDAAGCAISTAGMSILSERLRGMTPEDVAKITDADVFGMLGVPIGPEREKCALLGVRTLREALAKDTVDRSWQNFD